MRRAGLLAAALALSALLWWIAEGYLRQDLRRALLLGGLGIC